MLETDHLALQENHQEPITRPKLKRLIFDYLQQRSRKDLIEEALTQRDEDLDNYTND